MKPGNVKFVDRATRLMNSFTKGDRVGFQTPDGRMLEAMVLRLNKKTIRVATVPPLAYTTINPFPCT